MLGRIAYYLKKFDWVLLLITFLLISFGLIEIYSIALGQNKVDLANFKKQILFIVIGFILLLTIAMIDYNNYRSLSRHLYLGGAALLIMVLVFGSTIRGTRGWFNVFGFGIQPVEFIKIVLIIWLAKYFSSVSLKVGQLRHLLISGAGTSILAILVLMQPDFGSAFILFLIWLAMLLAAGFDKKYFIILGAVALLVFGSGWMIFFKDYQKERIMTFLNPSADPLNKGYNATQAMIAVGSGGMIGRGVGFGSQSQLKFLPESQNDFLFAVIAEELGFMGVFLVLGFFALFFFLLLHKIKKIKNDFGIYYIIGLVSLIFVQMFINIGMNMGIVPVVGISLPLMSYGGSSIIAIMIMIGIAESIIIRSRISY